MNNLFSLLLSVFISVIVAILSYYCTDDISIMNSILFGLLSFFILHVVITSINSERLSKDITDIKAKLIAERMVKSGKDFDYFWMLCSDKAIAGTYTLFSKNHIRIPHDQSQRFWQMAIANTDIKWECTHYVNDIQDFNAWIKAGFQLQGFNRQNLGLLVKRLFIFDKNEDINTDVLEHIKWQESIGIEVRILILENKDKIGYDNLQTDFGTIDIAIINDTYLMSFLLKEKAVNKKKQRSLNYIDFCSEQEKVKKAQQTYNNMWRYSITIQEIEG